MNNSSNQRSANIEKTKQFSHTLLWLSVTFLANCGCSQTHDPYAVPETKNVDDLVRFIEELENLQPATQQEINTHKVKLRPAIRDACDLILELEKNKTSKAFQRAIAYRVASIDRDRNARQRDTLRFVQEFFAAVDNLTEEHLDFATKVARGFERSGMPGSKEVAADAYLAFSQTFEDQPLAKRFEGSHRRLTLQGKPFEFEATDINGGKIDMEKLKGKVVLFDFWATWCRPCLDEIPNVRRNYNRYQRHGFTVVGVSIDQNVALLKSFVETNSLPWPTIAAYEGKEPHSSVERYGIMMIPQMILVGRDGKVIATDIEGRTLGSLLAREFPGE